MEVNDAKSEYGQEEEKKTTKTLYQSLLSPYQRLNDALHCGTYRIHVRTYEARSRAH